MAIDNRVCSRWRCTGGRRPDLSFGPGNEATDLQGPVLTLDGLEWRTVRLSPAPAGRPPGDVDDLDGRPLAGLRPRWSTAQARSVIA